MSRIDNDPNPVYRKPVEPPNVQADLKPMLRTADESTGVASDALQNPHTAIPNTSVQKRIKDNSRRTITHGHENKTAKQTHKTGSGIILSHHQKALKRARIG
jgi:hypothetical protein